MKRNTWRSIVAGLVLACLPAAAAEAADADRYWAQWRGPLGSGEAPQAVPPVSWSETENLRWKVPIPGRGQASPIVWGDRVFLLTAVARGEASTDQAAAAAGAEGGRPRGVQPDGPLRFVVMAIDRESGEILWERTAREEEPHEGTHTDATWASNSGVTDGATFFAHFGSRGLYAYDFDGILRWQKDLGDMSTRNAFGEGSSPVVSGDVLVVNWDHEGDSFVVALDKNDGSELWRRERGEVTSWSSPIVVESEGRRQVVVAATERTRGYDLVTGETVWEAAGMTVNTIPTPIHREGLVYVTSGFRGNALQAIRLAGAAGDISGGAAIVWTYDRDTPYVPSPVLAGGILYFLKSNSGILTALDAADGRLLFGPERLPLEGVYASPVAAAGRVYIPGRDGNTVVLRSGPKLEILAENRLDDGFDASPALVDGEIYLRGRKHLYCLAEDSGDSTVTSADAR